MVQVVTYDASPAAGAAPSCIQNTWTFFQSLMAARNDKAWWGVVSEAFNTCRPLTSSADVEDLAYWVQLLPSYLRRAPGGARPCLRRVSRSEAFAR